MPTATPNPNYVQPVRKEYKPGEKKLVKKAAKKRKTTKRKKRNLSGKARNKKLDKPAL